MQFALKFESRFQKIKGLYELPIFKDSKPRTWSALHPL